MHVNQVGGGGGLVFLVLSWWGLTCPFLPAVTLDAQMLFDIANAYTDSGDTSGVTLLLFGARYQNLSRVPVSPFAWIPCTEYIYNFYIRIYTVHGIFIL